MVERKIELLGMAHPLLRLNECYDNLLGDAYTVECIQVITIAYKNL